MNPRGGNGKITFNIFLPVPELARVRFGGKPADARKREKENGNEKENGGTEC